MENMKVIKINKKHQEKSISCVSEWFHAKNTSNILFQLQQQQRVVLEAVRAFATDRVNAKKTNGTSKQAWCC